jgi:hypothetical protein
MWGLTSALPPKPGGAGGRLEHGAIALVLWYYRHPISPRDMMVLRKYPAGGHAITCDPPAPTMKGQFHVTESKPQVYPAK